MDEKLQKVIEALIPWSHYRQLVLLADGNNWSLAHDMKMLKMVVDELGIKTVLRNNKHRSDRYESLFIADHYNALNKRPTSKKNRIAISYFHGIPGKGEELFQQTYDSLCRRHTELDRIQVTHHEMRDVVLSSGIDSAKVHMIPIGIDCQNFTLVSQESRKAVREKLGISENAFVIGSFQKDGNGWGNGDTPKLIKGPDIFLNMIRILKSSIPELVVLLSGPSRGFIKNGLKEMNVPYKHFYYKDPIEIASLYHALDAYVVSSRQEGGPKAVFESMSSGIPIVSTKVGQAAEVIEPGVNGWLAEVGDAEGLAYYVQKIYEKRFEIDEILDRARKTAEENDYVAQVPLWKSFFDGFVS